jgi:predicted RNA-binding Zn ribbon-like protein
VDRTASCSSAIRSKYSPRSRATAEVRRRLNDILALDSRYTHIDQDATALHDGRHWREPRQLLVPVAEAAASLFLLGDRRLVRHCEGAGCPMWFYDRTKAHRRRWCSMAVCGNRAKARRFYGRNRAGM